MLNKQPLDLRFGQGLDTKTDPKQVQLGKFLSLKNAVFNKGGLLSKRNGFTKLASLPDSSSTFLTTFNDNLTAIGTSLSALSDATNAWVNKGTLQPVILDTTPLIRSGSSQTQSDVAIAANGLACVVYTDNPPSGVIHRYSILDTATGQSIVNPTEITPSAGVVTGSPRVFLLGSYFIVCYTTVITATSHLEYVAISTQNPSSITAPATIASSYVSALTLSWDGLTVNNNLYLAYNTAAGGQSIKVTYLTSNLTLVTPKTFSGQIATLMSISADMTTPSNPQVYISYYDLASFTGYTLVVDQNLNTVLSPTQTIPSGTVLNMSSTAQSGVCSLFYEVENAYSYDSGIGTNYIDTNTIDVSGTVGTSSTLIRSVGLASKACLVDGTPYFLTIYNSTFQPTYFLVNGSGKIISKLAYSNGGEYYTVGLPSITVDSTTNTIQLPYLIKDLLQSANKSQGSSTPEGVYAQLGINLASYEFASSDISAVNIGGALNVSGGFIATYDGVSVVEQGFFVWPEDIEATVSSSGGSVAQQQYFYQVTYEWTDNQGNIFRSAPSIPLSVNVASGSGSASVTLDIPTLRLTYKTQSPPRIVVYRWSAAQQTYYQLPNAVTPLNDPTVDSIQVVDIYADSDILGDNIVYTTGGVIENISPPASSQLSLFNNRLFLIDAEDKNLLWYSKQIIESTPVEMSDLLTLYIAPTTGAQGSTGKMTATAPMDDKLIIFKATALGYINGIGPDNTGANGQYSDFVLINSTIGCINQKSIVLTPNGLMFQSNKGIWLLGRDLSTRYIGAPVEAFNNNLITSAVAVPDTNQVRFALDSGLTLMYDYYYDQWAIFEGIPNVSSVIYGGMHTFINEFGVAYQEQPGQFLDGSNPVLMSFITSWVNVAGLQGYERFYQMLLLGEYISPFKLNVQLAYDYNTTNTQATIVTPEATPANWGGQALWGTGPEWGGIPGGSPFKARVFPVKQKCESFQISINEIYDPTAGITAGAGLTLSGVNLLVGVKKGTRTQSAGRSFG